jgi:hypothetical protein
MHHPRDPRAAFTPRPASPSPHRIAAKLRRDTHQANTVAKLAGLAQSLATGDLSRPQPAVIACLETIGDALRDRGCIAIPDAVIAWRSSWTHHDIAASIESLYQLARHFDDSLPVPGAYSDVTEDVYMPAIVRGRDQIDSALRALSWIGDRHDAPCREGSTFVEWCDRFHDATFAVRAMLVVFDAHLTQVATRTEIVFLLVVRPYDASWISSPSRLARGFWRP